MLMAHRAEMHSHAPVVVEANQAAGDPRAASLRRQSGLRSARRRIQLQRLIHLRGLEEEAARRRIEAQGPQEAKLRRADVIIRTDGTLEENGIAGRTRLGGARMDPASTPREGLRSEGFPFSRRQGPPSGVAARGLGKFRGPRRFRGKAFGSGLG